MTGTVYHERWLDIKEWFFCHCHRVRVQYEQNVTRHIILRNNISSVSNAGILSQVREIRCTMNHREVEKTLSLFFFNVMNKQLNIYMDSKTTWFHPLTCQPWIVLRIMYPRSTIKAIFKDGILSFLLHTLFIKEINLK